MLDRIKWKIREFMSGRNGLDELNKTLFLGSLILYVISAILHNGVLYWLSLCGLIYYCYRAFSRNLWAREEENRKFVEFIEFRKLKFQQRKEYKIFKCKSCGRKIRVPRGKGKIEVTCPVCGNKTIHRT